MNFESENLRTSISSRAEVDSTFDLEECCSLVEGVEGVDENHGVSVRYD